MFWRAEGRGQFGGLCVRVLPNPSISGGGKRGGGGPRVKLLWDGGVGGGWGGLRF